MNDLLDLSRPRRVHLVGVGGAGMSGLARMLVQRRHHVSGSDRQDSRRLEELRALGADVRVGHDREAVAGADLVVMSSAINHDNVELVAARHAGIPVAHRSALLAALMEGHHRVLVAGTHGKTTTTSMTVVALQGAGQDPSFAIGGALNEAGAGAHAGIDPIFVAEADESDRSFLAYRAELAVVTNVELDHPDAFDDLADTWAAFRAFLGRRVADSPAVVCLDDPGSAHLVDVGGRVVTYGLDPAADVRIVPRTAAEDPRPGAHQTAQLRFPDQATVDVGLAVPGRHNLQDAAAALTVCWLLEVDLEQAAAGLWSFTGAQRRFQRIGSAHGVEIIDDYAHHPTEVRAALAAAREVATRRVVLVVQPHRYSRTRVLGTALGRATAGADLVVVTNVYGADEEPVPGVTGEQVAEAARQAGAAVVYQPHLGDVPQVLAEQVRPGDLVLVTGAGDVNEVGPALLWRLEDPFWRPALRGG